MRMDERRAREEIGGAGASLYVLEGSPLGGQAISRA